MPSLLRRIENQEEINRMAARLYEIAESYSERFQSQANWLAVMLNKLTDELQQEVK